jgi:hypothetical protein
VRERGHHLASALLTAASDCNDTTRKLLSQLTPLLSDGLNDSWPHVINLVHLGMWCSRIGATVLTSIQTQFRSLPRNNPDNRRQSTPCASVLFEGCPSCIKHVAIVWGLVPALEDLMCHSRLLTSIQLKYKVRNRNGFPNSCEFDFPRFLL